jgi:hypothetical protein
MGYDHGSGSSFPLPYGSSGCLFTFVGGAFPHECWCSSFGEILEIYNLKK